LRVGELLLLLVERRELLLLVLLLLLLLLLVVLLLVQQQGVAAVQLAGEMRAEVTMVLLARLVQAQMVLASGTLLAGRQASCSVVMIR